MKQPDIFTVDYPGPYIVVSSSTTCDTHP